MDTKTWRFLQSVHILTAEVGRLCLVIIDNNRVLLHIYQATFHNFWNKLSASLQSSDSLCKFRRPPANAGQADVNSYPILGFS